MEQDPRINALCNRLGHLWSKTKKAVVDEVVTAASLEEGERTVFGRLYGSPDVNFQALQSTMKKAWKSDKVICTHLEMGLFSFVFENVEEMNRILNSGPWSFSRHLLVLKPWEPSFIPHCTHFDSTAFWIHIIGLPVEGRNKDVISSIVGKIGKVLEIKVDNKGYAAVTICKAKVVLKLETPLESGMIYSYKGKELWIDFRYERLPIFCFSCGRIGHYAQNCKEFPYEEDRLSKNENIFFGPWLKTESNTPSPFWKAFYEEKTEDKMDSEATPETPDLSKQQDTTQRETGEKVKTGGWGDDRGKRKMREIEESISDGEAQTNTGMLAEGSPLLIDLPSFQGSSSLRNTSKKPALRESKKGRMSKQIIQLDESNLMETPVGSMEKADIRALVACPNKPPGYK